MTVNGPLDLTASGAYAYVTNGLTLDGTATLGYQARLYFNGSQTLGGTGTVVFNNASYQGLIANASNMTLTIGAGITIHGGNNQGNNLSSGSVIGYSNWAGGGSNTSIVNLGTISADTSGMSIIVNPNGGTLTNQGTFQNSNGGTLDVSSSLINNGAINPGGVGQAGSITVSGNFTQLPNAVLNIDIGGTTAGTTFDQLVITGSATLDGTVNLSRINGYVPTAGTTIPFLTYGSLSGSFATVADTNLGDSVGYGASSATVTLNLPITTPPQVTAINPPNGVSRGQNLGSVQIDFSKGLNPATLIAANFTLQDGNGNTYVPTNIQLSNGNSQVQLTYNPLPSGRYTLTLNAPAIMDPEGNFLGASNYVTHFTVAQAPAVFVNPAGGDWNTPSNWQNDQVPGPNDNVLINTGNPNAVITFSSGNATVNSLTSFEPFTLSGGTLTVNGNVQVNNTVILAGGTLTVTGDMQVNNTFTLAGGTLANATVLAGTGGQMLACTSSGGTLSGVTLAGNLDLASNDATVYVVGGLTLNNATVYLGNATGNTYGDLCFEATQTFGGTGTVLLGASGSNFLGISKGSSDSTVYSLTIGAGITIRGSSGTIGEGLGYSYPDDTIVNQGTITADGSGGLANGTVSINSLTFSNQGTLSASNGETLSLNSTWWTNSAGSTISVLGSTLNLGGTWSNPGTITATNSTVNLGGAFTTADIATLNRTGGTVNLTGILNNAGTTLALNTTTGSWTLLGGTILGGTLSESGGVELFTTSSGGTLSGVTLAGNLDLASNDATVYVVGGLTLNNATVYLGNATGNTYGDLCFEGTQTFGGTGTVLLGASGSNFLGISKGSSDSTVYSLTIGAGITIRGSSGTIGEGLGYSYPDDTIVNQGTITADGSGGLANGTVSINSLTFSNQGTLSASNGETLSLNSTWWTNSAGSTISVSGSTLNLGGTWSNPGTITATNSTVNLGGAFTTADVATFSDSGGTVNLTGTLNNAGTTLALNTTTGSWTLLGGTILGGTLSESGGVELFTTSSGGTLSGVTLAGNLDLASSDATVYVVGGLTLNNATVYLGNATGNTYGNLCFEGTQTFAGTGTVLLGASGSNFLGISKGSSDSTVYSLTIGAGITIRGSSGTIGEGSWYSYPDDTIINQGTIAADGSGGLANGTVNINSLTFSNQGTLSASNGETLSLNSTWWTNSAGSTISVTGSTLNLGGTWSNPGTITATNSTVNLGGAFTTADVATFSDSGGTVNLTGTLNNTGATLALDAATNSWNLVGGTVLGGTLSELGGAELLFTPSGGTLNGVTVGGNMDLASKSSTVYIVGGLTLNNATVYLGNATGNTYGDLCFEGTQTLGGTGTVLLGASGSNFLGISKGYSDSTTYTLTIGSGITIRGSSGTIGEGSWYSYPDDAIVNQGTIAADGSGGLAGGTIIINSATFTNQGGLQTGNSEILNLGGMWSSTGALTVSGNGTLNLGGTFTTADVATFSDSGGTVNLTGTLNNTGATLALNAATSSWNLVGGTILGGTLSESGGAELLFTSSGGTLNGVTVAGNMDLATKSSTVYIVGGLTLNNATVYLGNATGLTYSDLCFEGTQTLGGTGTVLFGASAATSWE